MQSSSVKIYFFEKMGPKKLSRLLTKPLLPLVDKRRHFLDPLPPDWLRSLCTTPYIKSIFAQVSLEISEILFGVNVDGWLVNHETFNI